MSGVVVTALCPGTVETAFHTPEMRMTNAMNTNKPVPAKDVATAGVNLNPNWGQSTIVSDYVIAGNNNKKYENFNFHYLTSYYSKSEMIKLCIIIQKIYLLIPALSMFLQLDQ